jgi:tetratricopeptide (TPR) repeat protein
VASPNRRAQRAFKAPRTVPVVPTRRKAPPTGREPEEHIVETPRVAPVMPPVFVVGSVPLALGVACFYALHARNLWVYDDYPLVVDAVPPRDLSALATLATRTHWNALPYYRPLSRLLLGAEQMLFGLDATRYHLLNAALMGFTAALVNALLRTPGLGVEGAFATLGALAVALHPAASEAVYPASVGPETLACFAVSLGAVLAWLRGGTKSYLVAVALLVVALLFKEQAVAVPLLFVACDALDLSHDAPGRSFARWRDRYAPVAIAGAAWFALRSAMITGPSPRVGLWTSPEAPLLSLLYTLQTSVLPRPALAYEPSLDGWLTLPHTALALGVALALAVWTTRRRDDLRAPIRFWALWFVAAVLPTANIFRQETAYAERYVLFALPAFAGMLAALASTLARRDRRVALGALGACVLALALGAGWRGRYYRDQQTFLTHWSTIEPHPHRALASLGELAHKRRDWPEATRLYRAAYEADPPQAGYVHAPLGQVLEAQGLRDEAIEQYRFALRRFPGNAVATTGLARLGADRVDEAALRANLANDPSDPTALLAVGVAEIEQGRNAEGVARIREALRREPDWQGNVSDHAQLRAHCNYNLARALNLMGQVDGAIAGYRAALVDDPDYAYANTNLALILEQRGERAEAATLFRKALRARPDLALARQGLDRVGP